MASVAIQKCPESGTLPEKVWASINALTEEVRRRAFELFEKRGGEHGQDVNDWLQAERDLGFSSRSELAENDHSFQARVSLPGFQANEVEVIADPNALIVWAESVHTSEGGEGDNISGKTVFHRLQLGEPIDVDRVTASLDKGILDIHAAKAPNGERLQTTA